MKAATVVSAGLMLLWVEASATAAPPPPDGDLRSHFAREPTVRDLQRAAARVAEVQPERVRSWLRRIHAAAALPQLRARVGRGLSALQLRGLDAYVPASDAWNFQIEAAWQLDRLVFDRSELGLARESQRLAARREALLTHVTQLYFERRRIQVESLMATGAEATAAAVLERRLAIDELTAILDGLTGGAMGAGKP